MEIQKQKILIVDADDQFRKLLKCILQRDGFEVCTVSNFEEGINVLRANAKFSIITVGSKDSKLEGFRFLKKAKKISPESQRILINDSEEKEAKFSMSGARAFFGFHQKSDLTSRILETINMAAKVFEENKLKNF